MAGNLLVGSDLEEGVRLGCVFAVCLCVEENEKKVGGVTVRW